MRIADTMRAMGRALRFAFAAILVFTVLAPAAVAAAEPPASAAPTPDLAAARAVFTANLDAIRRRDRDAYLACYLHSEGLARTGPTGFSLGFDDLAKSAGEAWPNVFDASDLRLTPVRDDVIYGTY